MKPIRTQYNGISFRSRLEARWAMFFDLLGAPYRYEHEGFQFGDRWYVPDFWLPEIGTWVEIKPRFNREYESEQVRWEDAVGLCYRLSDATKNRVILCSGDFGGWLGGDIGGSVPGDSWLSDMTAFFPGGDRDYPYWPCVCETCGKLGFEFEGQHTSARICGGRCNWNGTVITGSMSSLVQKIIKHSFWEPQEAA